MQAVLESIIQPAFCFYGNKTDEEEDRIVSTREVKKIASLYNDLFVEGSVKDSPSNHFQRLSFNSWLLI